eukprot:8203127-Pyramimonas_sp.AAC.1
MGGPRGPSWGHIGAVLDASGAFVDSSWADFSWRHPRNARMQNPFENRWVIFDVGFFGSCWR